MVRSKFVGNDGKSFRTAGQSVQYSGWTSTTSRAVVSASIGVVVNGSDGHIFGRDDGDGGGGDKNASSFSILDSLMVIRLDFLLLILLE